MDFLDTLFLSDEQKLTADDKQKLRNLGVESPVELLGMLRAERSAFSRLLGVGKARQLVGALQKITATDATQGIELRSRRSTRFKTGAVITARKPRLKPTGYDVKTRDALFDELQSLRAQKRTPKNQKRIEELEGKLNALLQSAV